MQFLNLALLPAIIAAAPTARPLQQATTESVEYLDKFDDLSSDPVGAVTGGGVGVYNGLDYAGFTLGSVKLPTQKQPPSPLNMVGGIADINPSCTIQLAGRKAPDFGGTTTVYDLVYDGTLLGGSYNHTSLPSTDFSGLVEVAITVVSSSAAQDLTLPQFDNIAYTAHVEQ